MKIGISTLILFTLITPLSVDAMSQESQEMQKWLIEGGFDAAIIRQVDMDLVQKKVAFPDAETLASSLAGSEYECLAQQFGIIQKLANVTLTVQDASNVIDKMHGRAIKKGLQLVKQGIDAQDVPKVDSYDLIAAMIPEEHEAVCHAKLLDKATPTFTFPAIDTLDQRAQKHGFALKKSTKEILCDYSPHAVYGVYGLIKKVVPKGQLYDFMEVMMEQSENNINRLHAFKSLQEKLKNARAENKDKE